MFSMSKIDWRSLLIVPKGRVSRKLFYIGFLINFFIGSVISMFGAYILNLYLDIKDFSILNLILVMLIQLPFLYLIFAIFSKRLHDINISSKWIIAFYMLYFIPQLFSHEIDKGFVVILILVSYIAALILFGIAFFKKGTNEANRYGEICK